ncbi:MAG: cation-translocating P-type ATPase [Candidatus Doudnabacteria bacterium]|jgi:Cd2+/Zn2+-exporting ATPase
MRKNFWTDTKKVLTFISGLSLVAAWAVKYLGAPPAPATMLFYLSIVSGGYFVFLAAVRGLVRQRFLNINFLVAIAAVGAIYIHQFAEAASVVFFFSLAEVFEEYGIQRSRKALESLIKKTPKIAQLTDGRQTPAEQVAVGAIIAVKPGDLIPLDGIVVKGLSSVDESPITGEAIPKDKKEGDQVFAGTINQQGYLEVKVTKESRDSTFAKIIKLVEQAQRSKAPAQEFIDKFAKYYTPSIVVIAFLIAVIPPLLFNAAFTDWFYRALVLLVIACPCALVISTPISIASAIGGASKRGILIKGGKYLEALGKIKAVAFDKTGTLTLGQPYVSDILTFNGFTEQEVLADAAGVGQFSSHPLSKSIADLAKMKGIDPHAMENYQSVIGKGNKATCLVCEDKEHCVGNLKYIGANGEITQEVLDKVDGLERQGKTTILVSGDGRVMGALAISDKLRPEAGRVVQELGQKNIQTVMLTGDNEHTAKYVGNRLGIKQIYASLLPDEKVEKIKLLQQNFGSVAMVGDGVNDAPSLASADVGIAMGAQGSDVAIETADVALMNNSLSQIPEIITLGRAALKIIKQNLAAALAVKGVFLLLALFGFTHLEYAIGADSGVAILVILNSLRLFSFSALTIN